MSTPLAKQLADLGLKHASENLDDLIAAAAKKRWGPTELLESLAEQELRDRSRRSLEHRLERSHLGRFKPMADFDWTWPKRIDRQAVEAVLHLDFVEDNRNVVLIAPQGLGKTMIAQNIAHNAVLAGTRRSSSPRPRCCSTSRGRSPLAASIAGSSTTRRRSAPRAR